MELGATAQSVLQSWQLRLFLCFIAAVYVYGLRPLRRWKLRHLPGPTPAWFLGSIPYVRKHGGAALAHQAMSRQYGPVWVSHGGAQPFVITDHPELARKMLLLSSMRPSFPSLFSGKERQFEAGNILAVHGEKHKSLRAAWQPMFFSGSLEAYSSLMNEAVELLMRNLSAAAKAGRSVDIHRLLGDMTMQVVGTTAFGVDFHTQAGDDAAAGAHADANRLRDAVNVIFGIQGLTFSWWSPLLFLFPFTAPVVRPLAAALPDAGYRRILQARRAIKDVAFRLIAEHRRFLAQEGTDAASPATGGRSALHANGHEANGAAVGAAPKADDTAPLKPAAHVNGHKGNGAAEGAGGVDAAPARRGVAPGSFLDLLMRATDRTTGRGFTDMEIANQAFVLILAGYETTANALAFTIYLLSSNPDKRAKLLAEVDAFGHKRTPTLRDLDSLPYLEAVLKESLRMYPPALTIIRRATRAMDLGGHSVAPGQWLAVAAYSMHRNPAYWRDPDEFQPERFLAGTPEAAAAPEHGWVPFGEGTRACIGLRFALEEAKIALLRLCQQFTFELEPGQVPLQIRNTITISPKGGLHVRVVPHGLEPEP